MILKGPKNRVKKTCTKYAKTLSFAGAPTTLKWWDLLYFRSSCLYSLYNNKQWKLKKKRRKGRKGKTDIQNK